MAFVVLNFEQDVLLSVIHQKPLLHFILPNLNTDYQTHYLTDSSLTRQFAYRATECTSVLSCSSFVPRGCAVLGIVLKVQLELREEDDVNMPKEKLVVRLPFCGRYFLLHETNSKPSSYHRTGKNRVHKKRIKRETFFIAYKMHSAERRRLSVENSTAIHQKWKKPK